MGVEYPIGVIRQPTDATYHLRHSKWVIRQPFVPHTDVFTRRAASGMNAVLTEAEWLAGNTSESDNIVFPATLALHFKGFALPIEAARLSVIRVLGSPFNTRDSYAPAIGEDDVIIHMQGRLWRTYTQNAPDYADPTGRDVYVLG